MNMIKGQFIPAGLNACLRSNEEAKETEILYGKPLGFIYKLLYGQYSATDSCNNTQFSADSTSYNTLKQ